MYNAHPSAALNHAFAAHPFQGVEPERARFLFVGLDANYSPTIEQSSIFPKLLDYLNDGVGFWQAHNVHHPFLLPEYRGDGRKYHKTFSRIGFTAQNASEVSFVELLHVPTYGRSALVGEELNRAHLRRLTQAIEHGTARHVFVSDGVSKLMRTSGMFPWIPKTPIEDGGPLKVWHKIGAKTIYWHYHFSVYGKFEQKKTEQLKGIGQLINIED